MKMKLRTFIRKKNALDLSLFKVSSYVHIYGSLICVSYASLLVLNLYQTVHMKVSTFTKYASVLRKLDSKIHKLIVSLTLN